MTAQSPPAVVGKRRRRGAQPTRDLQARAFVAVASLAVAAHQAWTYLS